MGSAEGIQVRFCESATYDSMIYALNLAQQSGLGGYWFASDEQTITLYLVSDWAFIPDEHYTRTPF